MRVKIRVRPNSGKSDVLEKDGFLDVFVRKNAEGGRANEEVRKLLKKRFGKDVKIVSGRRSRRKLIEVEDGD